MDYREFDAYVEAHADGYLDRLADLCRVASVSAEGGPALGQAADLVAEMCVQAGLDVEIRRPAGCPPIVLGRGGAGPVSLLVYNHYDVQPPDPLDEWASPPFLPERRGDALYARGVADNKGDLVARLMAVRAYRETVGPLPLRLCFVLEGEEEVGSPHLEGLARSEADLLCSIDGCLWEGGHTDEAGRPTICLGVKGVVSLELQVRCAATDAHSAQGGLYPNAAWRLVEALGTLRTPGGQVTVDGLMDNVRAPTAEDLALLEHIPFDAQAVLEANGMAVFLGGLTGADALRRLMYEPTCSINGLLSGYTGPGSKTVIPAQAMAKLDLRLVPDLTPPMAARLVREHLERRGFGDVVVAEVEDGLMPVRTDPETPIVQAAVTALSAVHGTPPVVYPTSAGSGPMHQLCRGIPAVSLGVGWAGSRAHAPNENIRVADFVAGTKVLGRLFHEFATRAAPAD